MNVPVTHWPLDADELSNYPACPDKSWDCADNMPQKPNLKPKAPSKETSYARHAALYDLHAIYQFIIDLALEEGYDRSELKLTEADLKDAIFGFEPLAYAYVAEHQGETVGFAICYRTFSTMLARPGMHLDDLYIAPNYRGAGLGQALLKVIEHDTARKGFARLEWWVLETNAPAQKFYKKLGADRVPEVQVYRMTHINTPTGNQKES
ncbi:MAG: GNAT family N-acetyltransferase [Paracoccaceae bacterium]